MLRIVTYNIHKCRGMDARLRPKRIADVLRALQADVIALQEVVRGCGDPAETDQAKYLADELGFQFYFGETRKLNECGYGNAILSRIPVVGEQVYDVTASWREKRGGLRADLDLGDGKIVHLFNFHLGTGYIERRRQAGLLLSPEVLNDPRFTGRRIVLGDFNEWTKGLTSKMLSAHLQSVDVRKFLPKRKTYPGVLPLMHLDHVYFDPAVELKHFSVDRSKLALVASDHLPLIADFEVKDSARTAA